ncbi:MAG: hypothetical protein M2R45_02879 [Verrucomicrobia subdivision 3 bacterium]|nr:hypothetical protein [Limisphaerales bacterium]MCS1414731.1 hypothetical protein [Limisphaerales bacterium]
MRVREKRNGVGRDSGEPSPSCSIPYWAGPARQRFIPPFEFASYAWLRCWTLSFSIFIFSLIRLLPDANAQSEGGRIAGTVTDSWEGTPLPAVAVVLRGTTLGATTDISGRFQLEGVPGGTHILIFSKSGYARSTVSDIRVIAGQTSNADLKMKPEFYEMEPFEVISEPFVDQSVVLLSDRQNAAAMTDSISSDLFSRAGAGNAAEIMTKVTGASVVGGKYVFIRGLGDRYSNTTLNGAEVPSPDPDHRAVQMDIFPSSSIESIVTIKTFTPDKPGSFSGGSVDIITKSFPPEFTSQLSFGATYNKQSTFNEDFLSYPGGDKDFIGFDDGTRDIPAQWGEAGDVNTQALVNDTRSGGGRTTESRTEAADEIIALSSLFTPVITPSKGSSLIKHNFGGSIGDTVQMFERDLGFFTGVSYERDFLFFDDGFQGRYDRSGNTLQPFMELSDIQAVHLVSWGSVVNLTYRLGETHELGFNFLYNRNSEDKVLFQEGFLFGVEPDTFERRVLQFTQRELQTYQIRGNHEFAELKGWKVDWIASLASTLQDQPDLRLFQLQRRPNGTVDINLSGYQAPTRYFRSVDEDNKSFKLDNTIPFSVWSGLEANIKFGVYYSGSERMFKERRFEYVSNSSPRFQGLNQTGDADAFLSPENLGYEAPGRGSFRFNKYIVERPFNNYEGEQDVFADYIMAELPIVEKVKAVGGIRYETTELKVESSGERPGEAILDEASVLPAAGLIYEIIPDMNLRLSYGKTLARPTYREITPISVFDVTNREILVGNPKLTLTSIDNYDIRWEWFPNPGEVLAFSLFYKILTDPIQKTTVTANRQVEYQNRGEGKVYGLELEARKNLDFIRAELDEFTLGGNFTYVESEVDPGPFDFGGDASVQLTGQSPYIVNLDLTYHNPRSETTASFFYNVFGPRLFSVGQRETPHIFEQPVHSLDFTLSQSLNENWTIKFSAKNLLNPLVKTTYDFDGSGTEYLYQAFHRGRSFGISVSYDF